MIEAIWEVHYCKIAVQGVFHPVQRQYGSQRWDGKVINVDAEWLEEMYDQQTLFPGRVVELLWKGRQGVDVVERDHCEHTTTYCQ